MTIPPYEVLVGYVALLVILVLWLLCVMWKNYHNICQGRLKVPCNERPVSVCYACKKRLCTRHTFLGDNHTYCYSCLYEKVI